MFQLQVVEAKRYFIPATKRNKNGEIVIDKETGKPAIATIPGPYRITFNDGHWVNVTMARIKVGTDENGKTIYGKEQKFSVNAPGAPMVDRLGRTTGQYPDKQISAPMNWDGFQREYGRCKMPELVMLGIQAADAEIAARRAA